MKAQMESGIVYGLTAALYSDISIRHGAVAQSNFNDYKMLRIDESPEIETYIINSGERVGGAGGELPGPTRNRVPVLLDEMKMPLLRRDDQRRVETVDPRRGGWNRLGGARCLRAGTTTGSHTPECC